MKEVDNQVSCTHCGKPWDKTQLDRSCSNCFACTACEAYICPGCRHEIVVKPPKPMSQAKKDKQSNMAMKKNEITPAK